MAGEKVLIIDDSSELRSLLESIMPYGGYEAVSAGTGARGLGLAAELNPDVILVDLELPDTSGLKVLEELNRQESTIPTIMMTGYGSEGVAAQALRLGVQGYLIKPFTTDEVLSAVDKALSVGRLRREKEQLAALLERHTQYLSMLGTLGRSIITGLDLDRFLQRVVEAGLFMTGAEEGTMLWWDEQSDQLQVVATTGRREDTAGCFSSLTGDERLRRVLQEGAAVRIHAPAGATIELQTGTPVRAVVQAPLKTQDRVFGLLSMARRTKDVPFGKQDEQVLSILADFTVMAMEKNCRGEAAALDTQDILAFRARSQG